MTAQPKIQDYAMVGDGRSAALISSGGSIDWLCWPRFDSSPIFGSLLDERFGGCWSISPSDSSHVERRYLDQTNVLESRFENEAGAALLTDFMPAVSEEEKQCSLYAEHELIRRVRCER